MNVRSAFRFAIVALLSTLPVVASAATYDVKVLFDVDSNRDTGCSVVTSGGTVRGVDEILTTSVSVNGSTGTVTGVTRQVCNQGANLFTNPVTIDAGGWNAGVTGDGRVLIETHYGNNALVAPGHAPVRLSFAVSSGSTTDALLTDLAKNAIIYPERMGRQRAVASGPPRSIRLDGNGDDWAGIEPLGYGGSSSPVLRFVSASAFSNGSDLFFNIQLQANAQAPTAVDDSYPLPALGATLQIPAPGILGNDTNPGSGTMVPVIESGVQHGQLTLNDDGSFTYINDGAPASQDQFRYRVHVGNLESNLATVTIVLPGGNPASGQSYEFVSADHTTFTTGVNGTFSVIVSGQPTPTLSVSGPLPTGVTFVDNGNGTGTLSGMPLAGTGGSYPLVITANKNKPHEASQNFTLTVNQPPAITSVNASTFTVGQAGTFTVTVTGFPAVSVTEVGGLPNGVTYNASTHVLSGTPAAGTGGVYNLVFTAANGIPPTANQNFTLTVNEAPSITSAASTTFQTGVAGTFTITTLGFPKPAITKAGTLPGGVTLIDNGNGTATLSGTPNGGTGGTYPLTLTATNALGNGNQNFTLTVNQPPAITSANNVTFTAGANGSFTVVATGFPAPSVGETGTLPNGVTYNAATHVLSGTPAAGTGGVYAISFTASNGVGSSAVQNFTLTINEAPSITSANATTFQTGVAGTFTITTLGWPKPSIAKSSGALPAGVTLTDNGDGTATLSGTPNAGTGGTYPVTLTATNSVSSSNQNFTLTVNQPPAITSANNVTFTAGTNGSFTVTATGFPAPAISESGALPSGITYNSTTHVLSGTAAALTGGVYNISFTASNGVGSSAAQNFTLTINEAPSITSASSTSFTVGDPGSFTVTVTGFPAPSVAEGGALPNGVTFNAATKTLSGTPGAATAGNYSITFTASNGVGSNAVQNFTLHVVCPTITITPSTLPGGTATQAYSQALNATGGHGSYTFAVSSGTLPAGITLSSAGLLSGTPTQTGTFNFTVTATDSLACVGGISLSLTINCPTLSVGPATLPNATQNVAYNQSVTGSGGVAPYTYTVSAGTLPAGLSLDASTGAITGTPTTAGTSNFTIKATDVNGCFATKAYTVNVCVTPSVTIVADNATVCAGALVTFTASPVNGGTTPSYQWQVNGVNAGSNSPTFASSSLQNGDQVTVIMTSNASPCTSANPVTSNTVTMTVNANPATPTITPSATAVCAASTGNTASGPAGATTYAWSITNGTITSATNIQSITWTAGSAGTTKLTLTVTNASGCSTINTSDVTVNPTPSAPSITVASAVCAGTTGNAASGPAGATTYAWSITGGTITSATNIQSITWTAGAAGTAHLTLTVTNASGCAATSGTDVTVNANPSTPAITTASAICANSTAGAASGPAGATTYAWSITGGTITSATDIQNITYTAGASGNVQLSLTVTNASGCSASNNASVTINANPATPTITVASAVCESSTGNSASGPAGATTYAWSITNGTITSAANIQNITWTAGTAASSPTVLTLTVTNASGCSTTNTANVTVNPTPSAPSITVASAVCAGSTGNGASGPAGATTYAWSITGGTITSATNIQSITWTAGAAGTAHLTLTVTNASGCAATSGTDVTVNANPSTPTITTASSICANSTAGTASGPAGATTYAWSITGGTITSATDVQNITYTAGASGTVQLSLTVTNASGCSASNNASVTINANPATPAITVVGAVCENSTGNSASGPAGATTYAWSITNGTITSAANIQNITWTAGTAASSPTVLTLTVTNGSGCSATNTANVTVNPTPSAPSITVASAVCAGSTGNSASGPAGATTYAWSITGGTITSATNIQNITWTAGAAGTAHLTLTVTNASSCAATSGADVTVNANPSTPTITTASSICANSTAGTASGPAATTWAWSITGGTITSATNIQSITYTAGASGTVQLSLTVTNASGCSASNSANVTINANPATPTITAASAVCEASTGNTASGPAGATTYAWSITNGTITSATNIQSITWTAGTAASSPTVLTLTVTNGSGCSATNTQNVTINPVPAVPTITAPNLVCGASTGNTASGPAGATTYAWQISGGGGTITSATNIQNITFSAGNSGTIVLTLTVTNASGCATSNTANVTVNPTITLAPTGANPNVLTAGTYNTSGFSQSFTTSGGTGPFTMTISPTTPPSGLSFNVNTATGVATLSGTPQNVGVFTFSVTTTDSKSCSKTENYSLTIKPKVVDDSFSNAVGNTQAMSSAYSAAPASPKVSYAGTLLSNDQSDQPMTVTATTVTNAGGSITYEATGNWLFTPALGFTGTATFAYTVTSNGASNSGNVNIAVSSMVWWTQPGAAVAGDGRSNTPFNNTSSLTAGVGSSGDIIYIYNNGGSTTNSKSKITLNANQTLVGEGVSLTVNSNLLRAAGTAPTLTNTTGSAPQDVVAINSGNTITGVTLTNGSASLISGAPAGLSVSNVTFTPSGTANGISLTGGSGAIGISNCTFTGTSSGDVIKTTNATANTTAWTFTNSPITQTAGRALNFTGKTGGNISFDSASPITVSAGAADGAITISGNSGGSTVTFAAKLALTTTGSARGFVASNTTPANLTITSTDTTSVLSAATAAALDFQNTTIGSGGLKFQKITSTGGTNGILINNTGSSGSFTLLANGGTCSTSANCTGGAITGQTGIGVSLNSTLSPSFDRLFVGNTTKSGVAGIGVTNFTFTNGVISSAGTVDADSAIAFNGNPVGSTSGTGTNITGTVTITGNTISNPHYSGIDVQCSAGTVSSANVSNNTISGPGFSGINFVGTGTASTVFNVTTATVNQNNISGSGGNGVQFSFSDATGGPGATVGVPNTANKISITNNSVTGLSTNGTQAITYSIFGHNSGSRTQGNFDISCNGNNVSPCTAPSASALASSSQGTVILIGNNGYATATGTSNNNKITATHTPNLGGGNGIAGGNGVAGSGSAWTPDLTLTVSNNVISGTDGNGILFVGRQTSGTMKLKISNNNVGAPVNAGGTARQGIRVDAGNSLSTDDAVYLNLVSNTSAGSNGAAGLGVRKQGTVSTTNDFGIYDGAGGNTLANCPNPTNTDVQAFLNLQNPAGGGTDIISGSAYQCDSSLSPP